MTRAALRRTTPLRPTGPPTRNAGLKRNGRLAPEPWNRSPARPARHGMAASPSQRRKIAGKWCVVCLQTKGITPAHLTPRSLGGCDDPDCVVPLCWMHHRAYDTGRLELLPHLEPDWRREVAHAVLHLGLLGAYRRLVRAHAA